MTNRVGIIEWVDNTQPLKRVIEDEIAKETNDVRIFEIHTVTNANLEEREYPQTGRSENS